MPSLRATSVGLTPSLFLFLRRCPTITASRRQSGRDGVVPLRMEFVSLYIEAGHLVVADFNALRIEPDIELTAHFQAGLCRRGGDQFHHRQTAGQRCAAPGLRDVTEQPVFDLVPLRGSR